MSIAMYKFCSTSTTIHYCQSWHDDDDDIFGIESEKRIYVEKYTIRGVGKLYGKLSYTCLAYYLLACFFYFIFLHNIEVED